MGTEIPADDHRSPYAASDGNADENRGEGIGGPYGGQGCFAHITAYNGRIHGIIQLLEEIAQDHGQGKQEQGFHRRVGHKIIPIHGITPILLPGSDDDFVSSLQKNLRFFNTQVSLERSTYQNITFFKLGKVRIWDGRKTCYNKKYEKGCRAPTFYYLGRSDIKWHLWTN